MNPYMHRVLFTIAQTRKQPEDLAQPAWVTKMRYTYTTECYRVTTENEIMSFQATWVDLEVTKQSEGIQKEKKSTFRYPLNVLSKDTNELICKTENNSETQRADS